MIEPHFFGDTDRHLLGIYHLPAGKIRAHGVVMCPPAPQEYMRTHMALRKLAAMLGSAGFHVLRFDYYGTGDSAGDATAGRIGEWRQNIVAAIADLKDSAGVTKVSLLGFRLGATLAATTPAEVAKLILLDPVVNGRRYLHELRDIHVAKFSDLLYPPPLPEPGRDGELLGVPFPAEMAGEIEAIDLTASITCRPQEVALFTSDDLPELPQLQARLQAASRRPDSVSVHRLPAQSRADHGQALLLPQQLLQRVTEALSGGGA